MAIREFVAQLGAQQRDARPQLTQHSGALCQCRTGGSDALQSSLSPALAGHHLMETPHLQRLEAIRLAQLAERLRWVDKQLLDGRRHVAVHTHHCATAPALCARWYDCLGDGRAIAADAAAAAAIMVHQTLVAQHMAAAGHVALCLFAQAIAADVAENAHGKIEVRNETEAAACSSTKHLTKPLQKLHSHSAEY